MMDPYNLLVALTIGLGVLAVLGLVITLMALEWSAHQQSKTVDRDDC